MEDSFKVRVDRLFGSRLFEIVPKSSFPAASWSVADGEVERREWNRERGVDPTRDETPCASVYDDKGGCFARKARRKARQLEDDLDDLDGDDEGEEERGSWTEEDDIRASVGLDSTLDREDEEDEYDRAAVCKEDAGDRIYMRDVNDHGPFMNYHSVVSDIFDDSTEELLGFRRDPRADHFAADARLKEDREIEFGENFHSVESSDDHHAAAVDNQANLPMSGRNLKPILKRKENQMDIRPKKQVRFNPVHDVSTKDTMSSEYTVEGGETVAVTTSRSGKLPEDSTGIPDYLRNPSKYIRYSFDTSDRDDDELNRQAFEDFRNIISRSECMDSNIECANDIPKSVVFTPRKKLMDAMVTNPELGSHKDSLKDAFGATGIAAGESCESETCAMDEDGGSAFVEEKNTVPQKMNRKYRSKASSDFSLS